MTNFLPPQTIEGTPGLTLDDAVHVMIPGRGRDATGEWLSAQTIERVEYAAELYAEQDFAARCGRVVCSGYKTPADKNGEISHYPNLDGGFDEFVGQPEADSARCLLIGRGVDPEAIVAERYSIDTGTNFARSEHEGHFGEDERPVAIVAQESHLERMINEIAPRTLRRPYIGVIVPEAGVRNVDGLPALIATRFIMRGITPETPDIVGVTDRRARRVWAVANALGKLRGSNRPAYNTESA